jgi:hypothetical protein
LDSDAVLEQPYLDAVTSALRDVAATFRQQPESFLFEADVQALLFARLFDGLHRYPISWQSADLGMPGFGDRRAFTLNPVKAEFPAGTRFDLALLAQHAQAGVKAWSQPVRVGIEIKLWQADQRTGARIARDWQKLQRYRELAGKLQRPFTGLCVAFCHSRSDWRLKQWISPEDGIDTEDSLVLPRDGIRSLVISAP